MAFLLCGSEGGPGKENIYAEMGKTITPQCFGLKLVSNTKSKPKHMESFTVVIERGAAGFGFSVIGSKPAKVKAVKEGSTAYVAGLRKDDHVIRINGENVSQYLAENVAKIVRQTEHEIILDVERESAYPMTKVLNNETNRHNQMTATDNLINLRLSYDELSESEQDRQAAINKLCQCEKDFLAQMHSGIQRYCDPLRHSLISPAEHVTLFQNVEKLVALSEYHVNKLEEEAMGYSEGHDNSKFINAVGSVYLANVKDMAGQFEDYCNGIKSAIRLLAELKEFEEFENFLVNVSSTDNQLTISRLISRPLEHIKSLVLNLQRVLTLTPLGHHDIDSLSQVVDILKDTCNTINDNNTRRCMSMTSLISMSRSRSPSENSRSSCEKSRLSFGSSRSSGKNSSSSSSDSLNYTSSSSGNSEESYVNSSGSSGIGSSIDPEVLDIQRRLVFSEEFSAFQLATATRHLIYAGHVTHVEGDRLYVILMSDLILLTKLEPDERLLVADHPILLRDVINTDFTDNDCLEFSLTVETPIDDEWVEECDIIFTAPSMDQKYTWKSLLEHRVESSKIQWDFLEEENFI